MRGGLSANAAFIAREPRRPLSFGRSDLSTGVSAAFAGDHQVPTSESFTPNATGPHPSS